MSIPRMRPAVEIYGIRIIIILLLLFFFLLLWRGKQLELPIEIRSGHI
jgi:hypothetical protein